VIKYRRGYEYLYKKYPGHYRRLIMNPKRPFRPNYEYLYTPYPPDDEDKWHHWCEYHNVQLKTDLIFCQNCNKIINPNRYYNGSMILNLIPAKQRYSIPEKILCQSCVGKENYVYHQIEEITNLTKEIRNMTRRSKNGKKGQRQG
jgi:hypothetical protein